MWINGQNYMNKIDPTKPDKLHLCLVTGSYYPPFPHGGVGSFMVDLAEGMVKRGHQVTCIGLYPKKVLKSDEIIHENINGVEVLRVPKPYEGLPPRIQAVIERFFLSKLVRKLHSIEHFDVIEGEDGGGRLALGRLPNVPKIIRLHATSIYNDYVLKRKPSRLMHLFEHLWLRRADFIVAVSAYVGRTTLMLTKLESKKQYRIIHYAINTELFKPKPDVSIEPGLIIFTGVLALRKGVMELIKAMNLVFAQNESAHLRMIGDEKVIYQGKPFTPLVLDALQDSYRDRVKLVGVVSRDNLPDELAKAELCCFPSHVETFGIGIAEAMAMEKPVVYMKDGPGPEVVENGVSGLLCDTWDPADIADKILYLLSQPEQAKAMGKQARHRILEKFEKENWVDRNIEFYRDCIKAHRPQKLGRI